MWLLGATDANVRFGQTTFFNAVNLRVLWCREADYVFADRSPLASQALQEWRMQAIAWLELALAAATSVAGRRKLAPDTGGPQD